MAAAHITLRPTTAIVAGTLRHGATRQRLIPTLHLTALAAVAITVAVAGTPEVAAAILAAVAITKSS